MAKTRPKYPDYPDSNWDYAVKETARMALKPGNKRICIYCHAQGKTQEDVRKAHAADCPARNDEE
jgi:hypothetical protein